MASSIRCKVQCTATTTSRQWHVWLYRRGTPPGKLETRHEPTGLAAKAAALPNVSPLFPSRLSYPRATRQPAIAISEKHSSKGPFILQFLSLADSNGPTASTAIFTSPMFFDGNTRLCSKRRLGNGDLQSHQGQLILRGFSPVTPPTHLRICACSSY